MYEESLKMAGLNQEQAFIYEFLLKNGQLPAGKISQKSPYKRGLVYKILEQLTTMGLVKKDEDLGKVAVFSAEHPSKLSDLIQKQALEVEEAKGSLSAILPILISDFNLLTGRPNVRFFEGKDGIIKIYEELLSLRLPIDSIEDKGEMSDFIPDYVPIFIKKRKALKIFNRVVCPGANEVNKTDENEMRETRTIPVSKYPFSMDIKICGDKVSFVTFKKDTAIGVLIDHPEVAQNFRLIFEYFWQTSKPQAASVSVFSGIEAV